MKKKSCIHFSLGKVERKIFLVMKITIFLLFAFMLNVTATVYSQVRKVSLQLEDQEIADVLREIEEKTEYSFFYQREQIDVTRKVSVQVEEQSVKSVLDQIFEGKNIQYQISKNNTVILLPELKSDSKAIQDNKITGNVADAKGVTLPGVNVVIKGKNTGTITNIDGNFSLLVNEGDVLVFSFVGFSSQEVKVNTDVTINIILEEETIGLNEVVAIGYGKMRKTDVTGSVSRVTSDNFNKGSVTNPLQQLQGRMSGVTITQAGSDPNSSPSIRIRGINSLAGGNDPLVVVDGVQGGPELLQSISPNDIESFDILKDASSTAIYGSRGAAGVVIVTTKRGKKGTMMFEFNSTSSIETVADQIEVMDAKQWRDYITTNNISTSDYNANTDWFKEITQNGYILDNNIALSGGNENLTYRASLSFINHQGIIIKTGSDKITGSLKVEQNNLNGKLRTALNLNVNSAKADFVETDNYDDINTALIAAYQRRSCEPVRNDQGEYFYDSNIWAYNNPVALLNETENRGNLDTYFGSLKMEYDLLNDLTFGVFTSKRKTNNDYGYYQPNDLFGTNGYTYHGYGQKSQSSLNEELLDISLNYKKNIDNHRISLMGVYEWQKSAKEGFSSIGRDFITDINGYNNLGNGNIGSVQSGDISSFKNESNLVSFLARLNYSFKDKYLLTLNVRHDGSTKLGKNNKWGTFPSASVAWRISQENFLKDSKGVDDLKLRLGYGQTGNQGGLTAYQSLRLLASQGSTLFNGKSTTIYGTSQNENEDLKWEVKTMLNFGIDFFLFRGKLNGSIDIYNGETDNMLYEYAVPVPPFYTNTLWANIGKMSNRGIEISIDFVPVKTKYMYWSVGFNYSKNKNKIKSLSGTLNGNYLSTDIVPYGNVDGRAVSFLKVGEPVGVFYTYKHVGVDEDGNEILADLNNDGDITIDNRSPDRYISGNPQPKFTYGFNSSFKYKNFDASIIFTGVYGNDIYNGTWSRLNRLGEIGILNVVPEAVDNGFKVMSDFSDFWIQDGSFLRLSNLTIGYNVPLKNKYLSRLRLSLSGNNLFVISNYKGVDPEVGLDGSSGFGIDDYNLYPRSKNFSFGLNFSIK